MDLDKILELDDSAEILAAVEECRAAKRAEDHAHRARITDEIWDDITALSSDGRPWPMDIIVAIAAGKIRHLKIIY